MRRIVLIALLVVGLALLAWAFSTRGKEGVVIFFLGAFTFLCTLVLGGLQFFAVTLCKGQTPKTNAAAILGALVGLCLGGFVGARMGFGRVMISVFNPDLPEQDFGTSLGAIGGGVIGAFSLALLSGTWQIFVCRNEEGRGS